MGELLRRRAMIAASGGPSGPLYPIPERTSGVFAGTGGQMAVFTWTYNNRFTGIMEARTATSSSAYNNRSTKFTIPANAFCEFTCEVIDTNGTLNYVALIVANSTSWFLSINGGAKLTAGQTYTSTKTTTDPVDIGEIGAKVQSPSGTQAHYEMKFTLTVNGVRYI